MIAPYKRSWCVVGSRHVAEIAPAASGGLLRETTAGEDSRTEGGDKTKIHELIVGKNLSRQWGEPHESDIGLSLNPRLAGRYHTVPGPVRWLTG
jgi:hypothetical protein